MAQLQFRSDDTIKWRHGFGDGSKGSSYAVPANQSCAGTSGTKTITVTDSTGFLNGDLVLIHQTRGTGAGNWQLNKLITGAGTATFTMESTLTHTYTRSGASQAQIIELNQYEDMSTGAITAPAWDGSKGGIIALFDMGTCTVNGTLTLSAKGFQNGVGRNTNTAGQGGSTGEGTVGPQVANQRTANGNGGGAGLRYSSDTYNNPGSGGGNGAAGSNSTGNNGHNSIGGLASGNSALTLATFGGGGGGNSRDGTAVNGADGAAMCFIFAKNITITGAIALTGQAAPAASDEGGGGGAGGSCLLKAEVATLGTTKITASGGAGSGGGGAGAVGRIHLDYSDSYTGTTSPAINVTEDSTIVPGGTATGNMFLVI